MQNNDVDMNAIAEIAIKAGRAILENKQGEKIIKSDFSPLTAADLASNVIISEGLKKLYPKIVIVSEESEQNEQTDCFFCIDPLDGTKEFLQDNGEYCVCIAYISQGIAQKSVIYAPESDDLFIADGFASISKGVDFISHEKSQKIKTDKNKCIALVSRSHPENDLVEFHKKHAIEAFITCGSALKFTRIATGQASLYARFVALSIWDIAAGDALVRAAGGTIVDHNGSNLTYYSTNLKAKPFIARA